MELTVINVNSKIILEFSFQLANDFGEFVDWNLKNLLKYFLEDFIGVVGGDCGAGGDFISSSGFVNFLNRIFVRVFSAFYLGDPFPEERLCRRRACRSPYRRAL